MTKKKEENVVEVAASGSVNVSMSDEKLSEDLDATVSFALKQSQNDLEEARKQRDSYIDGIGVLESENEKFLATQADLESKNKGLAALLDKRIEEVTSLEKKVVELQNALTLRVANPVTMTVIDGVEYVVDRHELLRDLIHLWRQQYIPDDRHVLVLKKKS